MLDRTGRDRRAKLLIMRVVLMRHGEAVDMRSAPTDALRWLTDAGRQSATSVGKALARLDLPYSCIYTSPLVRAVQTAEILAATHPRFDGPVEIHEALASEEGTTAQALAPLDHTSDGDVVVMVTHMPKVEILGAHLCQTQHFTSFRTAAACLIEVEDGRGVFRWMLDPETLEFRR